MARKQQSGGLGTLIVLGVGAYLAYTYWPQIAAAWTGATGIAIPGSTGAPAATPASAGTLVSTAAPSSGPVALAPSSAGTVVPTAPAQPAPVVPAGTVVAPQSADYIVVSKGPSTSPVMIGPIQQQPFPPGLVPPAAPAPSPSSIRPRAAAPVPAISATPIVRVSTTSPMDTAAGMALKHGYRTFA